MSNNNMSQDQYIVERMGQLGVLMMLAEEASELSQAASKLARARKLINSPTDMTEMDAVENLIEEYNDVIIAIMLLQNFDVDVLKPDLKRINRKTKRLFERLHKEDKDAKKYSWQRG